ncbi:MAG: hypothetical protein NVSMB17_05960 [Candidatus Dormibacteria bacterium]
MGYGFAAAAPVAVTMAVLSQHPSTASAAGYSYLFLGSVAVVALSWGVGPALLTAVVSAGLLDFYFVPPVGRLSIDSPQDIQNLVVFLLAAGLLGLLVEARRRQEVRAQRLAASLTASNQELERRRAEAEEGRHNALELVRMSSRIEALSETDRLKSELLANVSHELRTPLAAIVGISSAMVDPTTAGDREQVRRNAQTINAEGQHLGRLVSDLLEMSRLEAGAPNLQLDAVASLEALESAAERSAHLDPETSVTVRGSHFLVLADDSRLQDILRNLVENAARHSDVELSCEVNGERGVFEVADAGPGVPAEAREAVFERFHQLPVPPGLSARRPAGSGLGLAITRRLVESMGGRIWYRDRPGGGSIFAFELPLYRVGE